MSDKRLYMNSWLQNCFRFFIVLMVLLSAASVMAQDVPKLQWELVNPFRFIRDQDSVDELRRAYKG